MTVFALYRADAPGAVTDGYGSICVGLFADMTEALTIARESLAAGYAVSIEIGQMTEAAFDAIYDVPDDFRFAPPSVDAEDRK